MFIYGFPVMGLQYMTRADDLFRMAAEMHPAPAWSGNVWNCSCGRTNETKFCPDCGAKAPVKPWKCTCGKDCTTNFCPDCGSKAPDR
jgi:membrane protease subunit (stomatin/prohibitin family)